MTQPNIWTPSPDNNLAALARRIRIRPRIPPRARVGIHYEPQYLHWRVVNPDGSIAQEGEQHNLLLDVYKSLVGAYGIIGADAYAYGKAYGLAGYAVVGSGSSPPAPSQTGLDNEIARIGPTNSRNLAGISIVSDGVYDLHYIREYPAGTFNDAPLTEWGFSPSGTPGDPLMSRELFRDASGSPTTVIVSSSQKLQMHYYVRITLQPTTPQPASISISGIGTLTGQGLLQRWALDPAYASGPLTFADNFARAIASSIIHNEGPYQYRTGINAQIGVLNQATDLTFDSSISSPSRSTKTPGYNSASANGRPTIPVIFNATEAVSTIYGFLIGLYDPGYYTLFARYVFLLDAGQEFTKDNAHTLTIDSFTLTW